MRLCLLATLFVGSLGCKHVSEKPAPSEDVLYLRERVHTLERQVRDLDARLTALGERLPGPGLDEITVGDAIPYGASADDRGAEPDYEPAPAPPPPAPLSVSELYRRGHAFREAGHYAEAIAAYDEVLARFETHHLADNALYWSSLCHLLSGEAQKAIDGWKTLPLRFPESPKMPDALFGMAQAYEELGQTALAETLYEQLIEQYPKAEKVSEARAALRRVR